jgi:uncharacterized protein YfaP (DUF2135 family)
LHVIEPSGTHVYFAARNGVTATLDVDDLDGFGPENIFVASGSAATGTYQVFIVHYNGPVPTTSTITVSLSGPTSSKRTFSRTTKSVSTSLGYNVANVNVFTGEVTETTGTRTSPTDERGEFPRKASKP